MFLVFHHLRDGEATAAEIARVLRPGGRVLVRSAFSDRLPRLRWHEFFPRAAMIEKDLFPTVDDVLGVFATVGFGRIALDPVRERFADSLAESAARLRSRTVSTFEYLTEEEIVAGFSALDDAVAAEVTPTPNEGRSDLLVLGEGQRTPESRANSVAQPCRAQ